MYHSEDTWDAALSRGLREDIIKLLEEYADLSQLKFIRPLTPPDPCGKPSGITFSDGSEHAYGAVLYLRWSCSHGVVVRLVESKAKLTPLDQKGDPVTAEMCGAVFAARLKNYFQRHCRIEVERWYHLIDSQPSWRQYSVRVTDTRPFTQTGLVKSRAALTSEIGGGYQNR